MVIQLFRLLDDIIKICIVVLKPHKHVANGW